MSEVSIILSKELNNHQMDVLDKFKEFQQAMIDKNQEKLNYLMLDNYQLTHMSGKVQTKQEYIEDIVVGVLNYYKSTIIEPEISIYEDNYAKLIANVELNAKVYGINGTWTLNTEILMEKVDNIWFLSNWDN